MIQFHHQHLGDVLKVTLVGTIDESMDFSQILRGENPKELRLNCKQVLRMNSAGVRLWIQFFEKLFQKSPTRVVLEECSTTVVYLMNHFQGFLKGMEVESIFIPFICKKCGAEILALFDQRKLVLGNLNLPSVPCTSCGDQAVFDELPEEYFNFLNENTSQTNRVK